MFKIIRSIKEYDINQLVLWLIIVAGKFLNTITFGTFMSHVVGNQFTLNHQFRFGMFAISKDINGRTSNSAVEFYSMSIAIGVSRCERDAMAHSHKIQKVRESKPNERWGKVTYGKEVDLFEIGGRIQPTNEYLVYFGASTLV